MSIHAIWVIPEKIKIIFSLICVKFSKLLITAQLSIIIKNISLKVENVKINIKKGIIFCIVRSRKKHKSEE